VSLGLLEAKLLVQFRNELVNHITSWYLGEHEQLKLAWLTAGTSWGQSSR
jgi:hypothetical protein